jgi:hypothetical protein
MKHYKVPAISIAVINNGHLRVKQSWDGHTFTLRPEAPLTFSWKMTALRLPLR